MTKERGLTPLAHALLAHARRCQQLKMTDEEFREILLRDFRLSNQEAHQLAVYNAYGRLTEFKRTYETETTYGPKKKLELF